MARTVNKKVEQESTDLIWWRKTGKGSLDFNGHKIKPNQEFQARPEDIPMAFRDVVIPLQNISRRQIPIQEIVFSKQLLEEKGDNGEDLFDVVDKSGKKWNQRPLIEENADDFIQSLQAE
jgi:hypothetical protein